MKNFLCANDKLLLDWLQKSLDNPSTIEIEKTKFALQAFINKPNFVYKQRKIQAVGVSTDFDILTTNAFNVIVEEDNFDMGWAEAFLNVPRDENKDFWEIGTITNGITFTKVQEGQRIRVNKFSGEHELVYVDYYGGALGFTDKMIRYRQLARMFDIASGFRNKFFANKADNHYAILNTASTTGKAAITYQGAAGDSRIQRDILTLNYGAYTIGNANKDKGYGDMANAPLLLYANPFDEQRIESAYRVTTDYLSAGQQKGEAITKRPVRRIYTYNAYVVAGAPLLVLPKHKIQMNEAMAPTNYVAPTDVLTLNRVQSVWSIYGAAVGDTDQVYKLTLS